MNLQKQFDEIRALKDNWGGYVAKPIPEEIIDAGEKIMVEVVMILGGLPEPRIVPTADSTIQFEWDDDRVGLEIEVTGPLSIHYVQTPSYKEARYSAKRIGTLALRVANLIQVFENQSNAG